MMQREGRRLASSWIHHAKNRFKNSASIASASNKICPSTSLVALRRDFASSSIDRNGSNSGNEEAENMDAKAKEWLDYCIRTVRQHDPDSIMPGYLLGLRTQYMNRFNNNNDNNNNTTSSTTSTTTLQHMSTAYFAIRAFWVETGLRFGSTAAVAPNSTPLQHLEWWQDGMNRLVFATTPTPNVDAQTAETATMGFDKHPVLQLLHHLKHTHNIPWNQVHFDHVLSGRRRDLDVKQYDTLDDLVRHAEQSCGTLSQLVLQSGSLSNTSNPIAHVVARHAGIGHGLVNALRTSIPVLSITGKLVIPADVTVRHGVKSPRYLLSALSMGGDATCEAAMRACVADICHEATSHFTHARQLQHEMVHDEPNGQVAATAVLLPIVQSERFLQQLKQHDHQLTSRTLRHSSSWLDSLQSTVRLLSAFVQSKI